MRSLNPSILVMTAAVALMAATPSGSGQLTLREGSRLWFDGTSTVRSWSCTADRIDATINSPETAVTDAVLDGRKVDGKVEVDFPVAKLECKNGTMNEHMRKALKATDNPTIRFALDGYDLTKTSAVGGTLHGTLQLAGQSKPIIIPVQFAPAEGGLRVTGKVPLKMTEWGVKPPTLMLGTLKVGETVTVNFDLLLQH
ncbi:YceI family protein [Gemmatimonas aurantiaca]|uniref:YceI family protein n=1 Tax=Gemmatimonas aurantiaca TaxID=173480 RepID=UPI00301E4EF0